MHDRDIQAVHNQQLAIDLFKKRDNSLAGLRQVPGEKPLA